MALQKQNFALSFSEGVDTKTDDKQVIAGKLLVLENGVFTAPKKIQKRNGNQALNLTIKNYSSFHSFNAVPSAMEQGNFLANFNSELISNDNINLYSYSTGLGQWVYKGPNTICELSSVPIVRNTYSQNIADSAITTMGLQAFAWEDSAGNSRFSIVDSTTQQIIINSQVIVPTGGGSTIKPKCVALGSYLVIFYIDTTTNAQLYFFSYSNGVVSSSALLATDVNTSHPNYDICSANSNIYIAYDTSTPSIKVTFLNSVLIQGTVRTYAGINANNAITVFPDLSANIWVGYADSTTVKTLVVNTANTATVLAPTLIETVSNVYNLTGVGDSVFSTFFYDVLGSTDTNGKYSNAKIRYATMTVTGTSSGGALFLNSIALQSKAFIVTNNGINIPYVTGTHDANLQPTYFLCGLYNTNTSSSFPTANIISKIAPSLGGGIPAKNVLSAINSISSDIFETALLQKDLLFTSATSTGTVNTFSQIGVISATFDFTKTNPDRTVLGNNLHIGSGMLSMYDGSNIVEHGFHVYPEALTLSFSGSGGSLSAGSYGYQVVYEWTDNQGQVHRSNPSPVISGTALATDTATLIIPTLRLTAKSNVNIVVYRTQVNGTVYYRLNLPSAPLANSVTSNTVTYTDTASDASIIANQQLYTTGGEVGNISAPASVITGIFQNRIILIPSENGTSWWYSKQVLPNSPVEFSNAFVQNISPADGPITAVHQLDSNAIFFKQNTLWYVAGSGPTPAGTNNDFTDAQQIASDVGCINPESIVLMPNGLIFKSNKGIYLLNRGLAVQYIGADVAGFDQYDVTSAQLLISVNQVRFTLSNGVVLSFDYYVNQWSVFTNISGVSSTIFDEEFTYIQSNGLVLQETPGVFNDNGSFIRLRLVTSWVGLAGIQGFQRIYKALILGQYIGPHQLLVSMSYDFNPIFTQQTYINATERLNSNIYGGDATYGLNSPYGGQYPLYQWRIFPQRQTCESIQIGIEDVPFSGTFVSDQGITTLVNYNQSMSLSAITLELGIKKGLQKVSANKSFG